MKENITDYIIDYILKGFLIFYAFIIIFMFWYEYKEIGKLEESCKLFTGKKIIDKQIPKYLVFDNKKYLSVKQEFFNRKDIGDILNEEDCAYIDWNGDRDSNSPVIVPVVIPPIIPPQ